jgi:hypothetical protein
LVGPVGLVGVETERVVYLDTVPIMLLLVGIGLLRRGFGRFGVLALLAPATG